MIKFGGNWDSAIGDGGMRIDTPGRLVSFFDDIEKVYHHFTTF